jgi:hypothetical protein
LEAAAADPRLCLSALVVVVVAGGKAPQRCKGKGAIRFMTEVVFWGAMQWW